MRTVKTIKSVKTVEEFIEEFSIEEQFLLQFATTTELATIIPQYIRLSLLRQQI